jgi:hypothetical protein
VCVRISPILLICLSVLGPTTYLRSRGRGSSRPPSNLYQVRAWDEKSGGYRIGFIDSTRRLVIVFDRLPETANYVGEFHEG